MLIWVSKHRTGGDDYKLVSWNMQKQQHNSSEV